MLSAISGVPQGSILGPLLFTVFINNLSFLFTYLCVSSPTPYIFADDTKCLKVISNPTHIHSLQEGLDSLSNWSHTNVILLIESKPAHLHFGKEFGLHSMAQI